LTDREERFIGSSLSKPFVFAGGKILPGSNLMRSRIIDEQVVALSNAEKVDIVRSGGLTQPGESEGHYECGDGVKHF
jgi:hypothetical protein